MLSLKQCKAILNAGPRRYEDDEVRAIRDFLYALGHLDYDLFKIREATRASVHPRIDR